MSKPLLNLQQAVGYLNLTNEGISVIDKLRKEAITARQYARKFRGQAKEDPDWKDWYLCLAANCQAYSDDCTSQIAIYRANKFECLRNTYLDVAAICRAARERHQNKADRYYQSWCQNHKP